MSVRSLTLVTTVTLVTTMGAWAPTQGGQAGARAPALGPVERVGRASEGRGPVDVVVDRGGTTTAVWSESYATSGKRHLFRIRAAHRGPRGVWSAPRTIGCRPRAGCRRTWPALAVDRAGRVTAAWAQGTRVLTRSWTGHTGWGPVKLVADEPHPVWSWDVELAMAPNGAAVLAWGFRDRLPVRVARKPAHRPWAAPEDLGRGYGHPVAAVAGSGVAVVAFNDGTGALSAQRFVPGHGWSRRHWFGRWQGQHGDVVFGPSGRVLIVWGNGTGVPDDCCYMRGVEISPTGIWRRPFRFAAALDKADFAEWPTPLATIDSRGTETVAWIHVTRAGTYTGVAARRAAGGTWTYTRFPGSGSDVLQLVANADGDLALGFARQIRLRPQGGTWSAAARVGGEIGILPKGGAIRMWWKGLRLNAQTVR